MADGDEVGAAVLGCVAMLILVPIFLLIGSLFGGVLVYVVWNYAVAAAFHLAAFTFVQSILIAAGISFVGGCFKAAINKVSKD